MKMILKKASIICLLLGISGIFSQTHAANILDVVKMKSGTHGCTGNHAIRLSGTEQQYTIWNFRNFNSNRTINIDTIRIYDANGNIIFDSPSVDSVPARFKMTLTPHQSTQLRSWEIFATGLPRSQRPLQLEAAWSVTGGLRGLPPKIGRVRLVRDALTDVDRARQAGGGCILLNYERY